MTKSGSVLTTVTDSKRRSKLKGLYDYLKNNQTYLDNYEEWQQVDDEIYTSQVAESHTESIANARHKKIRKMQQLRLGAHNVPQIREIIASAAWGDRCQPAILRTLNGAA